MTWRLATDVETNVVSKEVVSFSTPASVAASAGVALAPQNHMVSSSVPYTLGLSFRALARRFRALARHLSRIDLRRPLSGVVCVSMAAVTAP